MPCLTTESALQLDMITSCSEDDVSPTSKQKEKKERKKLTLECKGGKHKLKKLIAVFKLLQYADRKNKAMLIISCIAAIISGSVTPINITTVLAPAVSLFIDEEKHFYVNETDGEKDRIDEMLPNKLVSFGYRFYIFSGISIIMGFTQVILSEKASQNILARIKIDYLSKLLSVNMAWFDKSEEQFVNTVSHDLQKMKGIFDSRMTTAVEIISFFICGNIAGLSGSFEVSIVTFTILMIALGIIYVLMQFSKSQGRKQRLHNGMCAKLSAEVLGNARTVAAYSGELNEIERFEKPLNYSLKYNFKQSAILSLARAFNYFIYCVCYAGTYYLATWFYVRDSFSTSVLVIVLIAQINVIYHSTALLNTISDLFMAMDSAYRVISVIETESNFKSSLGSGAISDNFTGDIKFKNVVFSYPTNYQSKVLSNLTLHIAPGKITAVVGTSGAGKSTIVGLITRLYDITAGQILIDGIDLRELNVGWLRNQIGVVMQEPTLFDGSIEENIRFGKPDASREEVEAAARLSYAHNFIKKLPAGYNSIVGERGVKLSGGQKQRIAIARALVRKPKLLLLDEATSALDSHSEEIVQEALDNAMRGRTTVIIAHRMTTVRKADVIYAMKAGEVIEAGSHEELMSQKGYYYSLVQTQEMEEKDKATKAKSRKLSVDQKLEEEVSVEEEESVIEEKESNKTAHFRIKHINIYMLWLISFIFCCLVSTFLPAFYYVFTLLCQTFSHPKEEIPEIALKNVLILVSIGLIAFVAVTGSGLCSTKATDLWLGKLRRRAFRKIVSMDISWFDKNGNAPNEILEIVTNCPALVEMVTGDKAAQVIIFFISILFTLVYSVFVNTRIALINIPIIFVFIALNAWRLKSKMSDNKSSSLSTKSTKIATEYVQSVKTIQLLNCQSYVIKQYEKLLQLAKKEAFKGVIFYAFVYGMTKALVRIAMGSNFIFGGPLIVAGVVRGSQLLGIVIALSTASMLAGPSLVLMSQYPAARQALSRLYKIIYADTHLNVLTDEGLKPEIHGNITFKDVCFSYPTRPKVQVLNKLNLKIEAGKTIALVGNSGCGKSTIISLLERFYLPTGGGIIIDGVSINEINVHYLRKHMGLVSQEPVLFDLSIKENILYGLAEQVPHHRVVEAARIANIHDFIMKLPQAYDTMVGERGSKLSGGQKQRIAIARAVLRDPEILLLDEATSALDTESEKIVQEALEKASVGRTTIVIAHRLSTIRKADSIAVLKNGVVVEQGTHEELVAERGHYYNLLYQS